VAEWPRRLPYHLEVALQRRIARAILAWAGRRNADAKRLVIETHEVESLVADVIAIVKVTLGESDGVP
jgi:hypothetical protein